MRRHFPVGFVVATATLHAAAVAFAGLGADLSPVAANTARWLVAAIHVGSVIHLAVRGGSEWVSQVLLAAPLALALGLMAGAAVLSAFWGTRPGTPLTIITACALPAVVAALVAPALGAITRKAIVLEQGEQ